MVNLWPLGVFAGGLTVPLAGACAVPTQGATTDPLDGIVPMAVRAASETMQS